MVTLMPIAKETKTHNIQPPDIASYILGGGIISWGSKKKQLVALSST